MIFLESFLGRRLRRLLASAAILGGLALAGCQTDGIDMAKAMKPLSPQMVALLQEKSMAKTSPILVRLFKEESELEVWKQDETGRFALLKTYPICRWSGELGPKIREGDRQAPEGFYTITPAQMNPKSQYYLSFNLGYPNAFDRAHGRTGAHLMVHGDCSSRGCYSMTDEQIGEIYALGRESFFGGQRAFQVQAYPFRMTPLNMAKHRNSPHLAFWKMLKEGYDHFEVTRQEPKVDVCEKRYVFNAGSADGQPLAFQPAGKCPAYQVDHEVASQVAAKTKRDEVSFAEFVKRGTPTLPVKTGRDGGMHPIFLAKLKRQGQEARDDNGNVIMSARVDAPGTIPAHVNPPRDSVNPPAEEQPPAMQVETASASTASVPLPRPAPKRGSAPASTGSTGSRAAPVLASADANAGSGNGLTSLFTPTDKPGEPSALDRAKASLARVMGLRASEPSAEAAKPASQAAQPAKPSSERKQEARKPERAAAGPSKTAKAKDKAHKPDTAQQTADAGAKTSSGSASSLVTGAQPVVPSGSFEGRWQGAR